MKNQTRNRERGVALFFSIFALLLLTAIGAALIFMASTETSVNSNYRQEQMAYFAAKAGVEEARARMMPSDPNTVYLSPGTATRPLFDPLLVAAPTSANNMIYYITNPGSGAAVQPWLSTDAFYDDELCHEGYTGFGGTTPPDERCPTNSLPAAGSWHQSFASDLPFANTASTLPYKWVRLAPKLNGSASYLSGTGATPTTRFYSVNPNTTATVGGVTAPITPSTLICWDGTEEVPLTISISAGIANCSQMSVSAGLLSGAKMTQVYVVTALGVTSSGARKMVQSDVALTPTVPFPYGLFATSTACPAISFNGNNASTNSYTTAGGGTYATTESSFGGDVGSNGGVSVGNGNVAGIVGVLQPPPLGNGTCAAPLSLGPNGTTLGPNCTTPGVGGCGACPGPTGPFCFANTATPVPAPYVFPTPPLPNPLPPNTSYSPPSCGGHGNTGNCMVPGTYGNLTVNGTLTLAPGTYNINSLSMQGNGQIVVSPAGALTLNIAGCGDATCSTTNALANPLAIAGNGITDDTIPNDFTINYAGPGTVSVAGNGDVTAILNAPNAAITQQGNGNWYGSILGSTMTIGGNAFFHFDRNAALAPASNGYYTLIGYHEVPY
jgi:hypothetical protein